MRLADFDELVNVSLGINMKRILLLLFLATFAGAFPAFAENLELSRLVEEDQIDRQQVAATRDGTTLVRRNRERRTNVLRMLREGKIVASIDYENAALVFQRGESPADYSLAHALATVAVAMRPDSRGAAALKRLSWDRLMVSLGRHQWFGSYRGLDTHNPTDSTVTNDQRSLIEQVPQIPQSQAD